MAFIIPNEASATYVPQAGVDTLDIGALVQAYNGEGVISGCAVSQRGAGANMSVDVAVGQVRVGGYFPYTDSTTTQNKTVTSADATNPRFDIVSVDYNGAVTVTAGTPAANPVFPSLPANSVLLASIYVPATVTSIITNMISDKRVIVEDRFAYSSEVISGGATSGILWGFNFALTSQGSGSLSYQTGVASHPGFMRAQTGATSGNGVQVEAGSTSNTTHSLASDFARVRYITRVATITSIEGYWGLSTNLVTDTPAAWGNDGVWFEYTAASSANFRCYTRASSTSATVLDTSVALVAGNWFQLDMIRIQNGNWQFAVNNAYTGVQSTNLPTSGVNFGAAVETQTSAARSIDIDFIGWDFKPLGQRWT